MPRKLSSNLFRAVHCGAQWLLLFTTLPLAAAAGDENPAFVRDISAALAIHDQADSAAEEARALEAFRALIDRYPDEWLAPYWTAYLATQVARLESRVDDFPSDLDPRALVRESRERLEQARKRAGAMNDDLQSDFYMLEGLIFNFHSTILATSEKEKADWQDRARRSYDQALRLNPRNPLLQVLVGIDLFQKDRTSREVIAGLALLDHALTTFEKAPNRALTTYWNKDFIPFWRARGEARLAELLAEE